jgi:hypothetical protein
VKYRRVERRGVSPPVKYRRADAAPLVVVFVLCNLW